MGGPFMLEFKKTEYRENIESFAIAVVAILLIIIFVAQSFLVKGSSMEPTIHEGERLIVNKFIFRLRPPVTGDIIVLKYPKDPSQKFIKRVIAGPSQTVSIQDQKVLVDGRELNEPYIKEKPFQNYNFVVVPEGTVFVMGDNRNGSKDSRNPDVGFVPLKNLVGKAFIIFWPPKNIQIIFNPKYNFPNTNFTQSNFSNNWITILGEKWRNLVGYFQNLLRNKPGMNGHSNSIQN
jgi:signal peptidase I